MRQRHEKGFRVLGLTLNPKPGVLTVRISRTHLPPVDLDFVSDFALTDFKPALSGKVACPCECEDRGARLTLTTYSWLIGQDPC